MMHVAEIQSTRDYNRNEPGRHTRAKQFRQSTIPKELRKTEQSQSSPHDDEARGEVNRKTTTERIQHLSSEQPLQFLSGEEKVKRNKKWGREVKTKQLIVRQKIDHHE
jgi:hypothetical protein